MHALAAASGRRHEQLRIGHPVALLGREIVPAGKHLPRGLDPVVIERRLRLQHHRAAHAKMDVAPVLLVLRVPAPLIGNANTAGVGHLAVDNQQLAVRAIVDAVHAVPAQRAIAPHLGPGLLHAFDQRILHLQRAHPVKRDMHFHARAGTFGQRVRKLFADLT
ncbi:hypothetical protein SDC9_127082 [bioreactor metagenome]|uniref:Uncharacterized protein n=1 Tax=bioreactor metagenome TaxID=1076179 RepID=A0A645CT62_9ZZZZ